MNRVRLLKWLFYVNLAAVAFLIGYKLYLNIDPPDFASVHTEQLQQLRSELKNPENYRFAVVGNINNSVGVFEKRFIPTLNQSDTDFLISAGNAVSSGGEDKYRALYGTLSHLRMPHLLTFGPHERNNFGSFRFYEHFGPYFYNFELGESQFIFLDSTGKTPWRWQLAWLEDLLEQSSGGPVFVFLARPLLPINQDMLLLSEDDYLTPEPARSALLDLFRQHRVDAVFSASAPLYDEQTVGGTRFITTGGAGGLVLNDEVSFYHYVQVAVQNGQPNFQMVKLEVGQNPIMKRLESLWFFIYSLFYVGYLNFALLVCALAVIAIKLYQRIVIGRDYYPNFDLDPSPWQGRPLRVAMFTNNFLPFIGGVPLSIERLRRGLERLGHAVLVVAPRYGKEDPPDPGVVRTNSLLSMGVRREFRLANPFSRHIGRAVRDFRPELVHLHHPIWLGCLGLWLARRLRVPAVYTYHTRLEHYAHFVPLPSALFRNLISHWLVRRFANHCEAVIVPTSSTEDYLRMIGVRSSIFVQPSGIDFDGFQHTDPGALERLREQWNLGGRKVLVSVSRLSNEKNIDFLLDGAHRIARESSEPFHLLIIGDGHQRQRLQERIEREGLQAQVTLVGAVPPERMPLYYQLGDLFVFASKSETQGMVILEAMAGGLPVVAIRSSGIDDVVREGENGYKTPDNLEPWSRRVIDLLTDTPLRTRMAESARETARRHSIGAFATDMEKIYQWVLAGYHTTDHSENQKE